MVFPDRWRISLVLACEIFSLVRFLKMLLFSDWLAFSLPAFFAFGAVLFAICFLLNCFFVFTCKFRRFLPFVPQFFLFCYLPPPVFCIFPVKFLLANLLCHVRLLYSVHSVCISKCVKCVQERWVFWWRMGRGGNSFGWDMYRGFVPVLGQLISDVSARHFAMHKNVSSARASEIYVRINIHVSEREK